MATESISVTVRIIRSFEFRNVKTIVYHEVNTDQKAAEFLDMVKGDLKTRKGIPPPVRNHSYDAMKIQHKAFGSKTSDPVINTENDEKLMISLEKTLAQNDIDNETEISLFNLQEYKIYQSNPQVKW
eukprot:Seg508.13 transcript_id=Seg508.13/GoldUCD/mRNA.D3Y31 product="UPF0538 protein C2orf76" protein_id=Seg508.13/GoldUCD/D3Y31